MATDHVDVDGLLRSFPEEFLKLSPDEQKVSIQMYRFLAEGQPVPRKNIATDLHLSEELLGKILSGWPGVYYDSEERILGYWGLALPDMNHRFTVNSRTLSHGVTHN